MKFQVILLLHAIVHRFFVYFLSTWKVRNNKREQQSSVVVDPPQINSTWTAFCTN